MHTEKRKGRKGAHADNYNLLTVNLLSAIDNCFETNTT
jgi:hypothetical protein